MIKGILCKPYTFSVVNKGERHSKSHFISHSHANFTTENHDLSIQQQVVCCIVNRLRMRVVDVKLINGSPIDLAQNGLQNTSADSQNLNHSIYIRKMLILLNPCTRQYFKFSYIKGQVTQQHKNVLMFLHDVLVLYCSHSSCPVTWNS